MVQLGLLYVTLCLSLLGQQVNGEWDIYDSKTKSMRNPAETEEQKCQIKTIFRQPSCNPVFKRFLNRLLNEVNKFDGSSQSEDGTYDASIKLSKQAIAEIQLFLGDEDRLTPGALDHAISQILVDLRPHVEGAGTWHFEGIFGVELGTAIKIGIFSLIIFALRRTIFGFLHFKSMFSMCFLVSIIWNWFYLYKIAFAEHNNNLIKMEEIYEKCNGLKKMTWIDSLKEWYRSTWTLQDDPCEKYYQVLIVDPLLLVPPTKAIFFTLATCITEPLKPFGQGISEFLRALLKDLPVTLQIPVLIATTLLALVFMYSSVQAVFQHGILAFFRQSQRETPHPVIEPPQPNPRRLEVHVDDEALEFVRRNQDEDTRADRIIIHWRRVKERFPHQKGPNEVDSQLLGALPEEERTSTETHENQQPRQANDVETSEDNANTVQSKSPKTKSNLEVSKSPKLKNFSAGNPSKETAAASSQAGERQPGVQEVQDS